MPVLTFGSSSYFTDSNGRYVIGSQALNLGAAITVSGTAISLASGGNFAIVGTSTQPLCQIGVITATILTFYWSTYIADASSNFIIDRQKLTLAGAIITSGTSLSYPSGGRAVVIGTSIEALSYATITSSSAATITFDGSTYTANTSSNFVIAGQTLVPGGVITVSSAPISYAAAGIDIVVGSSMEAIGLGGLIMKGFGSSVGHSLAGQYLQELLRMEF